MSKRIAHIVVVVLALAGVAASAVAAAGRSISAGAQVVVPHGRPLQITFTSSTESGIASYSDSFEHAIAMAVAMHPPIRGFHVQVDDVHTSCSDDNTASATAIVSNPQNVAVLGNLCSSGAVSALPIYEAAGIVAVSGSTTADFLPGALAPTVFDRTVVRDGDGGDSWYAAVKALPSDVRWQQRYEREFGSPPADFADLYFDATNLLLERLQRVSRIVHGNLVVDRAALAQAVRDTAGFRGVSCSISLDPATGDRVNDQRALARCSR